MKRILLIAALYCEISYTLDLVHESKIESILETGIQTGNAQMVKSALEKNIDPSPFLFSAITKGRPEIVGLLLKYKANPNYKSENIAPRSSAIVMAVATLNKEIIEMLLDHKANVNDTISNGQISPLTTAITGVPNPELVKLLLDRGANSDFEYSRGAGFNYAPCTALDVAVHEYYIYWLKINTAALSSDFNADRNLEILRPKIQKSEQILKYLIECGGPSLQSHFEYFVKVAPVLKPMLALYVEAIQVNTPLFNPLARLVIEYIYKIKVDAESITI